MPGTTTANRKQKTVVGSPKMKQMETSSPQAFLSQTVPLLPRSTAPVILRPKPPSAPNYKTWVLIIITVIHFSLILWLSSSFTSDDEQMNPNSFIQHEWLLCVRLCVRYSVAAMTINTCHKKKKTSYRWVKWNMLNSNVVTWGKKWGLLVKIHFVSQDGFYWHSVKSGIGGKN